MENRATQDRFLRPPFVIFRYQKICKKGRIEMIKKIYLETLKKCPWSVHDISDKLFFLTKKGSKRVYI